MDLLPEMLEKCNEVDPLYFVLEKTSVSAFNGIWKVTELIESTQGLEKVTLHTPLHPMFSTVTVDEAKKVELLDSSIPYTLIYGEPEDDSPTHFTTHFIGLRALLESPIIYGQPRDKYSFLQPAIERISYSQISKYTIDGLLDKIKEERGFVDFIVASPKFYGAIIEALSNELTEITIGKHTVKCYYDIIIYQAHYLSDRAYFLNTRYIKIAIQEGSQQVKTYYDVLNQNTKIEVVQNCNLICTDIDMQTIIKGDTI